MEIQMEKVQQLMSLVGRHLPKDSAGVAEPEPVYDALSIIFDIVNELHLITKMDSNEALVEGITSDEVEKNITENNQLIEKNINKIKALCEGDGPDAIKIQTLLDEWKHGYDANIAELREKFSLKPPQEA